MHRHTLHIVGACALWVGCGGATAAAPQTGSETGAQQGEASASIELCVMEIPGASLDVDSLDDGIALDFTTIDRRFVGRMRASVQHLAASYSDGENDHVHTRHEGDGELHYHYDGFPDAAVRYDDIRAGGRIELRATEPGRVESLREEVRAEAEMMRRGACPLLPGQTAGASDRQG